MAGLKKFVTRFFMYLVLVFTVVVSVFPDSVGDYLLL